MSNVIELIPDNAVCIDREALAKRIRTFADDLESGRYGEVELVCIVMDGEGVDYRCYGRPTPAAYTIGLLEWAKAKIMGAIA